MAKERKNKKKSILIPVLIVLFIIIAGVILWKIPLHSVAVTGNQYCTTDFIEGEIMPENQRNILMTLIKIISPKKEIQALEKYEVCFQGWGQVLIEVEEKECIAEISYGAISLSIDEEGVVLGQTFSDSPDIITLGGIPLISYEPFNFVEPEDSELLKEGLSIAVKIKKMDIAAEQLNYSEGTWSLVVGQVKILMGTSENMDGKLLEIKAQSSSYDGLKGTLHLEDYNSSQDAFYFKIEE